MTIEKAAQFSGRPFCKVFWMLVSDGAQFTDENCPVMDELKATIIAVGQHPGGWAAGDFRLERLMDGGADVIGGGGNVHPLIKVTHCLVFAGGDDAEPGALRQGTGQKGKKR